MNARQRKMLRQHLVRVMEVALDLEGIRKSDDSGAIDDVVASLHLAADRLKAITGLVCVTLAKPKGGRTK